MRAAGIALFGIALLALGGSASASPLDHELSREETARRLREVRGQVRTLATQGKRPVVVFDIDDTLVRHRGGQVSPKHNAAHYVRSLVEAGATVVYLTARPQRKQAETASMLGRFNFPLGDRARLLLNNTGLEDVAWKRSARPSILSLGTPLAFFDNDKAMVRLFREQYGTSRVFRLNTRSSNADPTPRAPGLFEVIGHYFE